MLPANPAGQQRSFCRVALRATARKFAAPAAKYRRNRQLPAAVEGRAPAAKSINACAGLTLVEIMVTLVILALVLGGTMAAFAAAANISKQNQLDINDAASLEEAVANNAAEIVESTTVDFNLYVGEHILPSQAVTYYVKDSMEDSVEDSRRYTVIIEANADEVDADAETAVP